MRKILFFFLFSYLLGVNAAQVADVPKHMGVFSGRISRLNPEAGLVRLKIDFANQKYLNKKDKLEFWDERGPSVKCKAYIIGKSNEYLLMKVPELEYCKKFIYLTEGAYLRIFSQDLVNNIKMGRELVGILLKKRLALTSKFQRNKKNLDNHIEKVNAINLRFKVLRDKLEAEWRKELGNLEEDRLSSFRNYKDLESRLLDIDNKLERYHIEDKNLKKDRWSLDPRLYYSK